MPKPQKAKQATAEEDGFDVLYSVARLFCGVFGVVCRRNGGGGGLVVAVVVVLVVAVVVAVAVAVARAAEAV